MRIITSILLSIFIIVLYTRLIIWLLYDRLSNIDRINLRYKMEGIPPEYWMKDTFTVWIHLIAWVIGDLAILALIWRL